VADAFAGAPVTVRLELVVLVAHLLVALAVVFGV
jgi:hypothetical protein